MVIRILLFAVWQAAPFCNATAQLAPPGPRTRVFAAARQVPQGGSPAQALEQARRQHLALAALPRAQNLSVPWTAVGPLGIQNPAYGVVSGRVTAIAIDPADLSGNTVYIGTTGGGVWKSTNAAAPTAQVRFLPLTDTLPVFDLSAGSGATPSLSIGALAIGGGVVLAGTGDPNDATDSYYGGGLLRSSDGGITWSLVQQSNDGTAGHHTFVGMSTAGLAFSTLNPAVAVAAFTTAAEAASVNAGSSANTLLGLYGSADGGQTWQTATVYDGSNVIASSVVPGTGATSVVWNPVRQRFYAVLISHGYFESADGMTWTRLSHQPGAVISTSCSMGAVVNSACPVFRGSLAVNLQTGDLFALTVDSQDRDQGLYRDVCGAIAGSCASSLVLFGSQLNAGPLEVGSGSTVILQADYNLALAAASSGSDTLLYVGTLDLYRCSVAGGCVLRNTTNVANGCATTARVASAQHAVAVSSTGAVLLANDGGLWRSSDGVAETGGVCNVADASHFDNLNASLGSLAEVVDFAQDPVDAGTLLAGFGALGSAGTGSSQAAWAQLATGEGGTVAIDQAHPSEWYVSTGAGVNIGRCSRGSACQLADFNTTVIGAAQTANDLSEVHAPWSVDSAASGVEPQMLVGTCRAWRGAVTGANWSAANLLSGPFAAPAASGCSDTFTVVRSLAMGGSVQLNAGVPNLGSTVLYAGMAGAVPGGPTIGGHLFTIVAADTASAGTRWTDLAFNQVTNAQSDGFHFNPARFDVSSIAVDPHDPTGGTVYATIMGFAGNGQNSPHLYRSADNGAHWLNISSNLPNAPANSVLVDPNDANTVYIALDTGVYVTSSVTNCAATNCWSVYGSTLPNSPVLTLAAAAAMPTGDGRTGELRAGTYGRGIWQIPLLTALAPAVPAMSLNPSSIHFPDQQVATQGMPVTVTVTNTGIDTLTVTNVKTSVDFVQATTCVGVPIAPSATCTVAVRFAPTSTGPRNGTLTAYGNVAGGQATAALSGLATAPAAIVLTPLTLDFGSVKVASASPAQNITVSNTGGVTTTLQSITISGDYTIAANSCGSSLAPQTGCTVSIELTPFASGTRNGSLTVVDGVGTQIATLTGIGTNPATDSLAPGSLSFAAQRLGTASPSQLVTLTNAGDAALSLIATRTTGSFSTLNRCGASLAAHASCSLAVTFVPGDVGTQTGTLTVSDEFRSQTIALTGIGVAPPGVSLAPLAGLTFPPTGVGLASIPQAVTLTNNGGLTLSISNIVATAGFSVGTSTCGHLVTANTGCTVQILSMPVASGPQTGSLTFTDNAGNSPQRLALNGSGVDFSLNADGATTLSISSGSAASYLLLLQSATGTAGSAIFTCSGLPVNAQCVVSPGTASLGAAGGTVLTVTIVTGVAVTATRHPASAPASFWWAVALPFGFLPKKRRFARRRTFAYLSILAFALAGCTTIGRTIPGGGGDPPDPIVTPSGTYPIVVAGSSAGLVRAITLTLKVQ